MQISINSKSCQSSPKYVVVVFMSLTTKWYGTKSLPMRYDYWVPVVRKIRLEDEKTLTDGGNVILLQIWY